MSNKLLYGLALFLLFSAASYAELRDPTRPEIDMSSSNHVTPFELTGIIVSRDRKIAVINGWNLRIGDEIAGERVIAINDNTVQLQSAGGKITLFLFDKSIKRASPNRF
jgi:hypothetical protein